MSDEMCKAERLAVAGVVAPVLRSSQETVRKRRVARVDKDGKVVGYTTLAELQEKVLLTRAIEIAVDDETRPKESMCRHCGKEFKTRPIGIVPRVCESCMNPNCSDCGVALPHAGSGIHLTRRHGAPPRCAKCSRRSRRLARAVLCVCSACGAHIGNSAMAPSSVARRNGAPPKCGSCAQAARPRKSAEIANCSTCGVQLGKHAMMPAVVARRNGAPPMCKECYRNAQKPLLGRRGKRGKAV